MPAKTTSFVLGEKLETFVSEQIASGEYASASEVMREALRTLKRRKERRAFEARLIAEGRASGISEVTHEQLWADLERRRAARSAGE
jgi:antitoxin ParD1/3/4